MCTYEYVIYVCLYSQGCTHKEVEMREERVRSREAERGEGGRKAGRKERREGEKEAGGREGDGEGGREEE